MPEFSAEAWDQLTQKEKVNIITEVGLPSGLAFMKFNSMKKSSQNKITDFVSKRPEPYECENFDQPDLF